ncbi:Hypothetical predicted protein, partial [Marmota monax]
VPAPLLLRCASEAIRPDAGAACRQPTVAESRGQRLAGLDLCAAWRRFTRLAQTVTSKNPSNSRPVSL